MAVCDVRGCTRQATEVVEVQPDGAPVMQSAVCDQHALELRAGAAYDLDVTANDLVMGDDLPLEIVDYEVDDNGFGLTFTLKLGRPPEIVKTVRFRTGRGFRFGDPGDFYYGPE